MQILINTNVKMNTFCKWADNGSVTGVFKLEVFDMVFAQKSHEQFNWDADTNNFMIEKLY